MEDGSKLQSVISKIQKLRALAGNNQNQNEMNAAIAAADKLIQEHRISEAQIEFANGLASEPFASIPIYEAGKRSHYIEVLLSAIAKTYSGAFCVGSARSDGDIFYGGKTKGSKGRCVYTMFATESDMKIISYFFDYFYYEVDRLARMNTKGMGVGGAASYRLGVAVGISHTLENARKQAMEENKNNSVQGSALVVLSSRKEAAEKEMTGGREMERSAPLTGPTKISNYFKGVSDGKTVSIHKGISG